MKPASTGRLMPVTPLLAGDSSHAMACATSIGSTRRFIAAFRASRSLFSAPDAIPASSAAPFGGKRLRDLDDAGLGGGVGVDRARCHARHRGDVDDRAVPPFGHPLADAARHEKAAAQIDIDLAIPVLHPNALDGVHLAEDAGGVDEPGDRTKS